MKPFAISLRIFLLMQTTHAFLPLLPHSSYVSKVKSDRGCQFGDRLHEVGSSWHPNLGSPFGVMYCIRCDCVKINGDNGKGIYKVTCQDIRKYCPATECKDPKVQRGECCASCPEAATDTKWEGYERKSRFASTLNDDGDTMDSKFSKKYYAILLNDPAEQMRHVARSTFTLHRENLHFTLQLFEGQRTHSTYIIQVMDHDTNVLHAHEAKLGETSQSRICGVWKNLPKSTLNALENERLSMKVVHHKSTKITLDDSWSNSSFTVGPVLANVTMTGGIRTHRALGAETFSSILRSETEDVRSKGGATAIISLSRNFKQIDFVVVFRNVAPENIRKRKANPPLLIKLELQNKNNETIRKKDLRITNKLEEVADSWNVNADLLRALGQGSLRMVLEAREGRRGKIGRYVGTITTKATCNLIQAVISGNNCNPPKATGSVGSAVLHINNDNTVSYQMTLSRMQSKVRSVQFRAFYRKRNRVIADVTAQFQRGEANGVLKEISARELHLIQNGDSWITVTTELHPQCEIQGNILSLLYNKNSARYKALPIPLSGSLVSPPVSTGAGGHAWLFLDSNCRLHYEIVVSGLSKDADSTVAAHLHGLAEISGVEPSHKKLLKGFYGTEARGILREIPDELYRLMNNGSAFVQVTTKMNPLGEIRGKVHIQNSCMSFKEGDKESNEKEQDNLRVTSHYENEKLSSDSCHFEGNFHEHGKQWLPEYDKRCTTCSCWQGQVLCKPVSCPPTTCLHPVMIESQCCPICEMSAPSTSIGKFNNEDSHSIASLRPIGGMQRNPNANMRGQYSHHILPHQIAGGCYQEGDPILHSVGSSWSPLVAPFGRIACVSCTCHDNNEITCERIQCPPVACQYPKRKRPGDCCKVCTEDTTSPSRNSGSTLPRLDWMRDGSSNGMCSFGKSLHAVGSSWKPKAFGLGEVKCITCSCQMDIGKGARVQCKRICPKISEECDDNNVCCPRCEKGSFNSSSRLHLER